MAQRHILQKPSLSASQQTPAFMETNGFWCLSSGKAEEFALMRYDILALKDEGSKFLRNVNIGLPRDTTSFPELRTPS